MSWLARTAFVLFVGASALANSPPASDAGNDLDAACEVDGGATVVLDGTASKDPDSTPGTNDDIVKYTWSEGGESIAEGAWVPVPLSVGVHELTLLVTDTAGATGTDDVTIVVYDAGPPEIACPDGVTVECDADGGSEVVTPLASAKDTCFRTAAITNSWNDGGFDPSGWYPVGATTVTFTATDAAGNTATCDAVVTVADTRAPAAVALAGPRSLWPPNHAMRSVRVDVQVVDACDPSPRIVLESVVSSEPDNAPDGGDGNTTNDIQGVAAGTRDLELLLRAERQSGGPGRTYTLGYRVTDASGNATGATGTVTVPHRGPPAF